MKTIDIIFLIFSSLGIAQGIILSIALISQKKEKRKTNLYIIISIVFMIYLIIEFVLLRRTFDIDIPFFYSSRYGIWFLIGPIIYLYTSTLLNIRVSFKKAFLHLLPFLTFTILIPLVLGGYLIHKHSVTYGMLTLLKLNFKYVSGFNYLYSYIFVIQFFHAICYFWLALHILKQHTDLLKQNHSQIDQINFAWLQRLIISFITLIILTLIFFTMIISGFYYDRSMDYIYMLPMAFIIYWIAYKALRIPGIFSGESSSRENGQKYKDSTLSPQQAAIYKENLLNFLKKNKPYHNSDLKLTDLASDLDISPRHLSQLINEQFNLNFYDFINQYRIEDAKEKLQKEKQMNILEIAYDVGFNNKTSFNNYFKKLMKMTPKEYRSKFT